jgi:hypothetical protein
MDRGLVQEAVVMGGRDDRCSCGAPHVAGSKFCNQCAAAIPSKPPPKAEQCDDQCSCGAPHVAGTKFCNQCGATAPLAQRRVPKQQLTTVEPDTPVESQTAVL